MSLSYDINSEKWLSIWKLNKLANPDYYETMRKYFVSLCYSMNRKELIVELDALIKETLEVRMGTNFQMILYTYKNLPALNSFTKSRNNEYPFEYVRKYELQEWLDEVERFIFDKLVEMESDIRFRDSQKIM